MSSYGKVETEKLKQNLENQLERLVQQLEDLEKFRDEMEPEDYDETKEDTIEQFKELNESLSKMIKGDITLVSTLGAVQLATQAAISEAFQTPEVIRLFGKREPKQLREKLDSVEQARKLSKLSAESCDRQKAEILTALRQLGEQLTQTELQFLERHNDISNTFKNVEFVPVTDD